MTSKKPPDEQRQSADRTPLPVPDDLGAEGLPIPDALETGAEAVEPPVQDGAPPAAPQDWMARARFSQDVHAYIRDFIRLADQKAAFFFAGGTALLAFLYGDGAAGLWLKPPMEWNIIDVVAFVATTALIVSILLAVSVVIPRTAGSLRGIVFWEAIAEYSSARDYADDVLTKSIPSLARARAEHCYDLAAVCRRKYRVLRVALISGAIGLASSLAMFVLR